MQKYIIQLIEDIEEAHRPEDCFKSGLSDGMDEMAHVEDIAEYLSGDSDLSPFHMNCGLNPINFPPVEKLNINEQLAIIEALTKMYFTWNIRIDLAENISTSLIYELNVKALSEKIFIVKDGNISWDFCESDSETCIYGLHCPCKEYDDAWETETEFARNWLKEFNSTIQEEFLNICGPVTLKIEKDEDIFTGQMFHFISNGYPGVPEHIVYLQYEFIETCEFLKKLFANNIEIVEFLNQNDIPWNIKFLHDFLRLKSAHLSKGKFLIEPFRFESDTLVIESQLVSPDELMRKLESGEIFDDEDNWIDY